MTPPALRIEGLHFQRPGSAGFSLDLPALELATGSSVFIYGPSGSGKSTLLNLIGGVLTPNAGRIELLGKPFSSWPASQRDAFRADHIGFVFQQFNLIPYLSVLDNVLLPCRFSSRRAARAADTTATAQRLLNRLDIQPDLYHRPASALSVGQQQRVAAARALMGQPEIIIADEPTSALDDARQNAFIELLLQEANAHRSAVLFVSHNLNLAGHFDQRLALD
jgi:putative ABC transport system ATP-binding protein